MCRTIDLRQKAKQLEEDKAKLIAQLVEKPTNQWKKGKSINEIIGYEDNSLIFESNLEKANDSGDKETI